MIPWLVEERKTLSITSSQGTEELPCPVAKRILQLANVRSGTLTQDIPRLESLYQIHNEILPALIEAA